MRVTRPGGSPERADETRKPILYSAWGSGSGYFVYRPRGHYEEGEPYRTLEQWLALDCPALFSKVGPFARASILKERTPAKPVILKTA
jgi:hypothetical protein